MSMIHGFRDWNKAIFLFRTPLNRSKDAVKNGECWHRDAVLDAFPQWLSDDILILTIAPLLANSISNDRL